MTNIEIIASARAELAVTGKIRTTVKDGVTVPAENAFLAEMNEDELADLFLVSQINVTVGAELAVAVEAAKGEKCERCWKFHTHVGANTEHPTLCPRCAGVVAKSAI